MTANDLNVLLTFFLGFAGMLMTTFMWSMQSSNLQSKNSKRVQSEVHQANAQ